MRRAHEEDSSDVQVAKKRRPKVSFACLACKKQKCRCELNPGDKICHRCSVLSIDCVFDENSFARFAPTQKAETISESNSQLNGSTGSGTIDDITSISSRLKAVEEATQALLSHNHLPALASFNPGSSSKGDDQNLSEDDTRYRELASVSEADPPREYCSETATPDHLLSRDGSTWESSHWAFPLDTLGEVMGLVGSGSPPDGFLQTFPTPPPPLLEGEKAQLMEM